MIRAKQKVCAHRRWLCGEIIRSKCFPNYNNFC
jgi:hypothetical protein